MFLNNKKALLRLGNLLAKTLASNITFFLIGNIGLGKTSITKSMIGRYIAYSSNIKSPTYNIVENYYYNDTYIYHFDLYRIKNKKDFFTIDLYDYNKKNSILFIEWGEKYFFYFLTNKFILYFFYFNKIYNRFIFINSNYYYINEIILAK